MAFCGDRSPAGPPPQGADFASNFHFGRSKMIGAIFPLLILTAIIFLATNEAGKLIESIRMFAPRIYEKAQEIDPRLVSFRVTRQELTKVVLGVVAARADTVENDPITAEGQLAYIFGTRFLRSLFRGKGYFLYRKDNIEAVKHPERELKIIYQSVDVAADRRHNPKAISGKGPAANRIINSAQGNLFTEEQLAAVDAIKFDAIDTGVWYFCVSVDGDDVRAELSLPTRIEGDNFKSFIERIFIVCEGEWRGLAAKLDAGAAAEFEPIVTRK